MESQQTPKSQRNLEKEKKSEVSCCQQTGEEEEKEAGKCIWHSISECKINQND